MDESDGQDKRDSSYKKSMSFDSSLNINGFALNEKKDEDKLDFLFDKQNELFKKHLENNKNKMQNLYEINEPFEGYRIFMLSSAIIHEVIELQKETNWKWWKKESELANDKIQEEIIDIWHFLIQLSIEVGLDSKKLMEKYVEKNQENLKRQVNDY